MPLASLVSHWRNNDDLFRVALHCAAKEVLYYERQLPEPPPPDSDLVSEANAYRSFISAVIGGSGVWDF